MKFAIFGDIHANLDALQTVMGSAAIQHMKLRYLGAQSECAELLVRYLTDHHRLEACEKKLAGGRPGPWAEIKATLAALPTIKAP